MQSAEAIEFYSDVMKVVKDGDDATVRMAKDGSLVIYRCTVKKVKKTKENKRNLS